MRAIITGANGQDGQLLAACLRQFSIDVLGLVRAGPARISRPDCAAVNLVDVDAVERIVEAYRPDLIFHLAACHHSADQREAPGSLAEMTSTNFHAAEVLLSIIQRRSPSCRLLLAGSSQMYTAESGQTVLVDETTPMRPASFYGRTKAWSRELLAHYRDHCGVFGAMVVLFNHESTLRPLHFISRKISLAAARAALGDASRLQIQDLTKRVDWSSARDVVDGMRCALLANEPADYVLASGTARPVRELLEIAFAAVGLDWAAFVAENSSPSPASGTLIGNSAKARRDLGWRAETPFSDLIREMVLADLESQREFTAVANRA